MIVIVINADYDGHIHYAGTKQDNVNNVYLGYIYGKGGYRSYFRFPLTSLPNDATVTQARVRANITGAGGAAGQWDIHGYDESGQTDPEQDSGLILYDRCASGNLYKDDDITWRNTGQAWITLGGNVCVDIENAKSAVDRFSLGIHEEGDNDTSPVADASEKTGGKPMQLEITYEGEAPPAEGYQYSDGLVCVQVAA